MGRHVFIWARAMSRVWRVSVAAALIVEVPAFGSTRRNGSFP